MPDVQQGESKDDYLGRCMGDSKMVDEFGNPAQRAAVCNTYFEDKKGLEASYEYNEEDEDEETVEAAEYKGKKVTLNKPFRTQGGAKKFAVYVQNGAGRVVIVRFGDPNMEIKRDDPKRRKAFRDRHNCAEKKDRTTPGYWSCRQWSTNKVEASYDELWSSNEGEVIEGIEEAEDKPCCGNCTSAEAKMISKDVFDNPGEASKRAKEMGLEGFHSHEEDGKKVFMPGKNHEEYMSKNKGKDIPKKAYYNKDKEKAMAGECPIGEEMVAGSCQSVNVTMELSVDEIVAKVEASTGKNILEIKGVAFHEGYNKNKWAITKRGAEKVLEQMIGSDLTLNHPKAKDIGFERNMDGGVDEANVGKVISATISYPDDKKYEVKYTAHVYREELFEALESGLWLKPEYGVSIGGYGIPIAANEDGMVFDNDFTFDHLAIVHKPAYNRATIESVKKVEENAEAKHGGQHGKPGKNDPRKTPAKPDERRKGSKKNPPGSAKKPNSKIVVSPATRKTLQNKMQEHNKKGKGSKASMGALLTVFRRGAGAFSTSHAPNMSRNGWGVARVNAFIHLLRTGRPSNPNYKQDNDLLPKGHSRSKRTASTEETLISQTVSSTEYRKEITSMSEEDNITETLVANEMEDLQAQLVLARAELEEMKAIEMAKAEEDRQVLVSTASELGLKGHDDLSSTTLTSLIASWKDTHKEPVVEMAPAVPASESSVASEEAKISEPVVANYLNGKIVSTPQTLYAQAWNAWASSWNKTLSGGERKDERVCAPNFEEMKEMI
mgnify:CR=1 FL=1